MLELRPCDSRRRLSRFLTGAALLLVWAHSAAGVDGLSVSSQRLTPVVRTVRSCAPSVVNIQGQKSVAAATEAGRPAAGTRQVNGMGTGVVLDPRGYILTNHHVVDGVRQINVTLASGQRYVARVIAHDRATDLAVIRIRTPHKLPVIELGSSHDLMTGESVVAVGNAFGYEHTVTTGIISALHRNVQVNETQQYLDLIQTDASINPGNSGGPLMNVDGQMIGLNVAVRAGAQGIGFAIPVNKALDVATRLMSIENIDNHWHGMTPLAARGATGPVTVSAVDRGSPADEAGVRAGDALKKIGAMRIKRPIDVERALIGRKTGEQVKVSIERDGRTVETSVEIAATNRRTTVARTAHQRTKSRPAGGFQRATWDAFGLVLETEARSTLRRRGMPFSGGMRVVEVRPGSSAAEQGVVEGDILVRIHRWYTTSEQDVRYVLNRRDSIAKLGAVRFDIVRGQERYFGHLALSGSGSSSRR